MGQVDAGHYTACNVKLHVHDGVVDCGLDVILVLPLRESRVADEFVLFVPRARLGREKVVHFVDEFGWEWETEDG